MGVIDGSSSEKSLTRSEGTEPFPYEVPELQELYEKWRASEADAKAVLDAACAGLGDTPPPQTPRALLSTPFIFRGSSQPAREGNVLALMAPPNTRATSPLFNPTNSPFKNLPSTPRQVKVKKEHDETNTDWIKNLTSQLSPKPEDKGDYNRSRYQLRRVRGMININAHLTPKIPSAKKTTPKKTDHNPPSPSTRALRSRNEPLYALYDNRGKTKMEPLASIETPLKASMICKSTHTPDKESPNTMQGVLYTSPEPSNKQPRRPIHPLLINTQHALEKRKQLHPDPELAMVTPSNGFHLRKRPKHQTPF